MGSKASKLAVKLKGHSKGEDSKPSEKVGSSTLSDLTTEADVIATELTKMRKALAKRKQMKSEEAVLDGHHVMFICYHLLTDDHTSMLLIASMPLELAAMIASYCDQLRSRSDFVKLGRLGGRGSKFVVKDELSGDKFMVAVMKKKTLKSDRLDDMKRLRALLVDGISAGCPFVLHLHCIFQTFEALNWVFDLAPGGDLFELRRLRKRLTLDEAFPILAEITSVLAYLHDECHIAVCDVSPENVLLSENGHVKLRMTHHAVQLEPDDPFFIGVMGTPEYMAPEVIRGEKQTFTRDWWSLGIMCYELLVGIPPFYDQRVTELYAKIERQTILFPPTMRRRDDALRPVIQLIESLLDKDPRTRLGCVDLGGSRSVVRHALFMSRLDIMDGIDSFWHRVWCMKLEPVIGPLEQLKVAPLFDEGDDMFRFRDDVPLRDEFDYWRPTPFVDLKEFEYRCVREESY